MEKKYKFKDLKIFSSTESMVGNTRRYRQVFENLETTYLYAELSFYNKLFDEEDWKTKVNLKAFQIKKETREELCDLVKEITVGKDQNIVMIREGWGNKDAGSYWLRGDYEWEAYIDGELVGTQKFYVENGGLVNDDSNPYFNLQSVCIYEGPDAGLAKDQRKYLTKFNAKETEYVWVEVNIENQQSQSWYCELFFNYYNDSGQLKGSATEMKYINSSDKEVTVLSGWGSTSKGTWYNDKYRLEITFMDQLLAVVPFDMGDEFVEGAAPVLKGNEVVSKGSSNSSAVKQEESLEEVLKSLNEMIGLTSIKTKINDYTSYLKFLKLRQDQGFEESGKLSLHSVFTGNPGTGKTTVAKMLGQIYHKMGLLSKGKVTEVGRAELVGKFIGQTAPQVKEIIEKARGGVLFIDEAYSLMREGDSTNDFGQEVVEVLLKEMSDGKGDLAIIVAGYPKEMNHFLTANPGLRSRFNLSFHFDDYLPQELMDIAKYSTSKRSVVLSSDSETFLYERLIEAYRTRDRSFGNARLVTSLIDEAKMNMGLRLMRSGDPSTLTADQLKTIEIDDVKSIFKSNTRGLPDIRLDEALLTEALAELNTLTGMEDVKEEINEIVKLVRFYRETGKDVLNKFSLHTVFTGNPGTGKTTVARIVAKVYKALGILERGHIVEVDRQGLVASYLGQTATKTMEAIDRAEGGVLFIDEAYALASSSSDADYGKEAIETLLKQMEDRRGRFVVVVAGYTDNMNHFLETNPGLKSRFDRTVFFEDYSSDELLSIALNMLQQEGLTPDTAAREHLKNYLDHMHSTRDKFFGNARSVRKVVKEAIKEQNLRMASLAASDRTSDKLSTLTLDDLKDFKIDPNASVQATRIGFRITK
ncbi:MAG TPA: AAA family ATPase [Cytophagaceae bacterium]|nr:AAA family ATPase [Cytophagaceae bacterium]